MNRPASLKGAFVTSRHASGDRFTGHAEGDFLTIDNIS